MNGRQHRVIWRGWNWQHQKPALIMNLRMDEGTMHILDMPPARSACAIITEFATLNEVLGLEM